MLTEPLPIVARSPRRSWQPPIEAGGSFSERDLAEHRTDVLDPIQTTYRGWRVLGQPPVSQGLIVLIALNILEGHDPPADPSDRVHLQVEAHKLALTGAAQSCW